MTKITNLIEELELYLEGVKIPTFNSITISEQENAIPSVRVTFATNYKTLRILPGTMVHVFIKTKNPSLLDQIDSFLIFEGQITTMEYTRNSSAEIVAIVAMSILGETYRSTIRPGHALITSARNDAELNHKTTIRLSSQFLDEAGNTIFPNSTETTPYHEGTLNQLKEVASFGDLSNTMATAFNQKGSQMSKGNFIEFFREMHRFFMQTDIYYGIHSVSYKLSQSIFVFPNKASGYDLKVAQQGFNNMLNTINQYPAGSETVHILMNLIEQFKTFIGYKYICPAAPFSAKYFHIQSEIEPDSGSYRPLRMVFMPNFESAPPALCNIFYPEQVSSLTYSRDFMSELTRMIGQLSYSFIDKDTFPGNMMPITVVPDVNVHKVSGESSKAITSNYTDEESYRGVTLKVSEHDSTFIKALYNLDDVKTIGEKKDLKSLDSEDKKDVEPSLKKQVLNDYLTLKYGQRAVQFTAEWSPYRVVGLPAMLFEKGKPTIIGILQSSTVQITASGAATASYVLKNARLILDEDESIEKIIDDKNNLNSYIVSEYSNSGFLGPNPLMYVPKYYSMENIGKEIYPYIINGNLNKGEIKSFFDEQESPIYYTANQNGDDKDYSILKYLTNISDFQKNNQEEKKKSLMVYNTRLMYEAVKAFKKTYTSGDYIHMYSTQLRRLLTKSEYLHSIDKDLKFDENSREGWKQNSKDLKTILNKDGDKKESYSGIRNAVVTAEETLNKNIAADINNISSKDNGVDSDESIFRPFNTTRRAHVQLLVDSILSTPGGVEQIKIIV